MNKNHSTESETCIIKVSGFLQKLSTKRDGSKAWLNNISFSFLLIRSSLSRYMNFELEYLVKWMTLTTQKVIPIHLKVSN